MELKRGMRGKIYERFGTDAPLEIKMSTRGSAVYDYCCFGVDENDILSDDRYMVFYNQTSSPSDEITYRPEESGAVFTVSPEKLPDSVRKVVFTVSIDGEGSMGEISGFEVSIGQTGCEPLVMQLTGADFSQERAIISVELYLKNEWRFSAVAQGFNGGLSDLLEAYGGEEAPEPDDDEPEDTPTEEPAPEETSAADFPAEEEAPAPEATETPAEETPEQSEEPPAEPLNLEKPKTEEKQQEEEPSAAPMNLEKPKNEAPAQEEPPAAPKISLKKLGDKPINLSKNDKIELRKQNDKPVNVFTVGLGWDPVRAGASVDCDSSVFLCKNGKLVSEDDIVAFYNRKHKSGAVTHHGDNLTGAGEGDDEQITIDLNKVPKGYDRIVVVANIFLSRLTRQHFGKVKNCYIRLVDSRWKELCRYTLSDNSEYNKMHAMIFGEFVKENGVWVFNAIGEGTKDHSIGKLAKRFK